MLQNIPSKKVRLNVQIPFELKDKRINLPGRL